MMSMNWTDFKSFIDTRKLKHQMVETSKDYLLAAKDDWFGARCAIPKDSGADQTDYETNYKANANATFTDADGSPIIRLRAFNNADSLRFRGTGITGTHTKNSTTNIDYQMPEDRFINGVDLLIKDHVWGDKISFQVVDVDNLLGYGAGLVLDEFGKDWYVDPDKCDQGQLRVEYPALVSAGFYIRIAYTSVGTVTDVSLSANLFLHKKP